MDLDAELERLSREARKKLEAERGPAEEAPAPTSDAFQGDAAADEARRLAARPEGGASLGFKVATVLGGLVAVAVIWSVVIAPLLKLAFVGGVIALVVWVIIKLMDDGPDDEDAPGKGP
ncbi:MAG: hypothetical protein M9894_22485 [Planctomycetes bacterium]|nr:hypothetical protein [Planctomycetota bacterium]